MSSAALADLLWGALGGGGLLHLLMEGVQIVGGRDNGKKQEEQAGERDRKLKDRLRATLLAKPEIGSRAKEQEPA
jgi:hypothetical protein